LYCNPNEGTAFPIINDGSGILAVSGNCATDAPATIATTAGGTMTRSGLNFTYTPPTAGFTGVDTFNLHVTTVWNGRGGPGSAGGTTSSAAGPATLLVTLNVIPATATLNATAGVGVLVPVPAGSISNCSAPQPAPDQGPAAAAVLGCIGGISAGTVAPSHGSLVVSGNTLRYTALASYSGTDTFSYRAQAADNYSATGSATGNVTVTVTVAPSPTIPTLGTWGMIILALAIGGCGLLALRRREVQVG
jgi:hypothetical protein